MIHNFKKIIDIKIGDKCKIISIGKNFKYYSNFSQESKNNIFNVTLISDILYHEHDYLFRIYGSYYPRLFLDFENDQPHINLKDVIPNKKVIIYKELSFIYDIYNRYYNSNALYGKCFFISKNNVIYHNMESIYINITDENNSGSMYVPIECLLEIKPNYNPKKLYLDI
jgi:hypothetical protein